MSKNALLARTFLSDKDVFDLLESGGFSHKSLLVFLQQRGFFVSNRETHQHLANTISQVALSWNDVQSLIARCDSDDRKPRQSTKKIVGEWKADAIDLAITNAQQQVSTGHGQTWTFQKSSDGKVIIEIKAIEIHYSRAKSGQRIEVTTKVEIEPTTEGYVLRHDQLSVAADAAKLLRNELKSLSIKPATEIQIEMPGVRDPVKRSEFFIKLHRGVVGFKVVDTIDVKIDSRLPEESPADDEDSEEQSDSGQKAEIKGMVKHAVLSGSNVLTSELSKTMRETGYYIYSLVWSAKEMNGESRTVDFEAGFSNPVEAKDFTYSVRKVHSRKDELDKGRSQAELLQSDGPRLLKILEKAAYETYDKTCNETSTS